MMPEQVKGKKIAVILLKDFKTDPRVLREVLVLRDAGYDMWVYIYNSENLTRQERWQDINIVYLARNRRRRELFSRVKHLKPVLVISHDLTTLLYGVICSLLSRSPLVYDSHELYLETYQFASRRISVRLKRTLLYIIERLFINRAEHVITVNDLILRKLMKRYGLKEEKLSVIMNTEEKNDRNSLAAVNDPDFDENCFNLVYQGILAEGRGLEELCKAMVLVRGNARLYIYGDGPVRADLEEIIREHSLQSKVRLMGRIGREELLSLGPCFDAGMIIFKNTCMNNYLASPNKLFEYISAGLPVVASNFPFLEKFIVDHGVGITIDPEDTADIAARIDSLAADPAMTERFRKKALEVFESRYNWQVEGSRYLEVIRKAAGD